MTRLGKLAHAIFFRRYDRWEWLAGAALLAGMVVTGAPRLWVAATGVVAGRQLERAVRAARG